MHHSNPAHLAYKLLLVLPLNCAVKKSGKKDQYWYLMYSFCKLRIRFLHSWLKSIYMSDGLSHLKSTPLCGRFRRLDLHREHVNLLDLPQVLQLFWPRTVVDTNTLVLKYLIIDEQTSIICCLVLWTIMHDCRCVVSCKISCKVAKVPNISLVETAVHVRIFCCCVATV